MTIFWSFGRTSKKGSKRGSRFVFLGGYPFFHGFFRTVISGSKNGVICKGLVKFRSGGENHWFGVSKTLSTPRENRPKTQKMDFWRARPEFHQTLTNHAIFSPRNHIFGHFGHFEKRGFWPKKLCKQDCLEDWKSWFWTLFWPVFDPLLMVLVVLGVPGILGARGWRMWGGWVRFWRFGEGVSRKWSKRVQNHDFQSSRQSSRQSCLRKNTKKRPFSGHFQTPFLTVFDGFGDFGTPCVHPWRFCSGGFIFVGTWKKLSKKVSEKVQKPTKNRFFGPFMRVFGFWGVQKWVHFLTHFLRFLRFWGFWENREFGLL